MEEIVYFEINNWFAGRDYPMMRFSTNGLRIVSLEIMNGASKINFA